MNAANDNAARKGLRGWWASPPRPGMQRLINYRNTATSAPLGSRVLPVALSRPQRASCASRTPPTDGRLLPGSWGAEPRGWLLVRHHRSLLTSPSLSPRAATSPRFALPNDRRESSTRSGGRGRLGCPLRSITYASGYRFANRSERPGNSLDRRSLRTSCDGPPAPSVDCSICDGAATSPVAAGCSSRRQAAASGQSRWINECPVTTGPLCGRHEHLGRDAEFSPLGGLQGSRPARRSSTRPTDAHVATCATLADRASAPALALTRYSRRR
jgi:hypothetical protein